MVVGIVVRVGGGDVTTETKFSLILKTELFSPKFWRVLQGKTEFLTHRSNKQQ